LPISSDLARIGVCGVCGLMCEGASSDARTIGPMRSTVVESVDSFVEFAGYPLVALSSCSPTYSCFFLTSISSS
jgi:hypothetical protein